MSKMKEEKNAQSWRGWYVSIVSALTAALSAASASQFSTTLAPLAAKLNVTEDVVALSDPIKSAVVVIAMLIAPTLIRKYGMRTTFILSLLAFLVPQSLMPYASSYFFLVTLKAAQGFSALLFPLVLTLIMEWNSPSNMGLATSIFTGVFYAGGAVGGTLAGFAAVRWGWAFSYHLLSAMMVFMGLIFLSTVSSKSGPDGRGEAQDRGGAYRSVVKSKLTWFLVIIFLPTVWTIQAIWADMVPFGLSLGYTETETGGVMGISALAILTASLISGKASDFFSASSGKKLKTRIEVFSVGAILIAVGTVTMIFLELEPPSRLAFNSMVFLLSFGAAWGLGSFYCIIPEIYAGEEVTVANGFIGGIADMAMPLSPVVMAVIGIRMGLWNLAWFSSVAVCAVGLFFSFKILEVEKSK